MATYTYNCNNEECEIHNIPFEVQQSMKDARLTTCPDCEHESLERLLTPSGGFRIGGMGVHKPTAHWGKLMSQGRKDLLTILSSTQTYSVFYWVSLLNLFDKYKDEFNISDMRLLVAECEDVREWFNDKNPTDRIRKEDTRPNIYVHLEELETNEYKKRIIANNKESLPDH